MMGFNAVFTQFYQKIAQISTKKYTFQFFSPKHLLLLIYWRLLKV